MRSNAPRNLLLVAAAAALLAGCGTLLDRERYSLIVRRPAHRYHELTAVEREELARYEPTRIANGAGFRAAVAQEPFRPFAHCRLHDSRHIPESLVAVAVAPVEYPATLGGEMTGIVIRGVPVLVAGVADTVASAAVWAWGLAFPARKPPPPPVPGRKEAPPR